MTRTPFSVVLLIIGVSTAAGLLVQQALASTGRPAITPPLSLTVVLIVIGVIVVGLAVPVRRAVRGNRVHVDPFYALRVLVLAKASALSGALLGGAAIGSVVFLVTRTVPTLGSVGYSIGMAVGALVLLVGGLVAEGMCRIPPPSEEDEEEPAGATS